MFSEVAEERRVRKGSDEAKKQEITTPCFAGFAMTYSGAIVFSFPHLLPVERGTGEEEAVFRLPERSLWILGVIAFCTAIGEGAMADWSGVYLTKVLNTKAALAVLPLSR